MKYEIKGGSLPVLQCDLASGEKLMVESGGMSWMTPNMKMETTSGGIGKMVGRMFSGEKVFRNIYTADGDGMIAIASSFPGSIMPFEVSGGNEIIFQKHAYLAGDVNVETSVAFSKKIGAGLFGGEGFVLQKASGNGVVFLEIDGSVHEIELQPGQQIVVSTGNLAAMSATCKYDIQSVKGLKNKFLGGEGLFNTVVTGPGKVYLQSMPISGVASAISPYISTVSSGD